MKYFVKKYSHAWVLLYFLIYMPWFSWLEKNVTTEFSVIHIDLDDKIPFLEIFGNKLPESQKYYRLLIMILLLSRT